MPLLSRLTILWRNLFRKGSIERDLDEELQAYLELLIAEKINAGMSEEAARRAARIELGGAEQVKEQVRDVRAGVFVESVYRDFRYGARALARSPALAVVAVLSLGLGIGANTAIFTLLDHILLKALPIHKPEEVVVFVDAGSATQSGFYPHVIYNALRDRNQSFSALIASRPASFHVAAGSGAERIEGEVVSGNYFQTLGVNAAAGRTINPEDDRVPGGHPVAMLSYRFWQTKFAGDPGAIGKQIRVNGLPFTIIGVTPARFFGSSVGRASDIRIPMAMIKTAVPWWTNTDDTRRNFFTVMGRLKPGVSTRQAESSLNPLFQQAAQERYGRPNNAQRRAPWMDRRIELHRSNEGYSSVRNRFSRPLAALMAIAGGVLLIACANLAGLLLARATARSREIAIRLALGAGRARLIRQTLIESMILAGLGGTAGLLFAWLTVDILVTLLPGMIESARMEVELDHRVLAFATAVSAIAGLLFGLAPAFQSSRTRIAAVIQGHGPVLAGGSPGFLLRKSLIVFQVALSIVLITGAGLFLRSLNAIARQDMGIDRTSLIEVGVNPMLSGYSREQAAAFHAELTRKLEELPDVRSVAATDFGVVFQGEINGSTVLFPGSEAEPEPVETDWVNSRFFTTFGIRLLRGRTWRATEEATLPTAIAVVNQAFANRYFQGQNPVGKKIGFRLGRFDTEVIGVVADNKYVHFREAVTPFLYLPIPAAQFVSAAASNTPLAGAHPYTLTVRGVYNPLQYARAEGDPRRVVEDIRRTVRDIDPDLPLEGVKTLDARAEQSLAQEKLVAWLSSAFGLLATALAAIGLYGLIAYSVIRRTREIGLRMALGAQRSDVLILVLRELIGLTGIGVLIGVPAALALTRLARGLLFGVSPTDPPTLAAAVFVMFAVAMLAGYVPARRAVSIDPLAALRHD